MFQDEASIQLFIDYVKQDTAAIMQDAGQVVKPSSDGQVKLSKQLRHYLAEFGMPEKQVMVFDDQSFVCIMPGTMANLQPVHVGFSAHLDTHYDLPGKANPMFWYYEQGDIVLPHNKVVIPAVELTGLQSKTIITTDGTSLLGADCKCGVAAMVMVIKSLLTQNIEHGPLSFWFCVDEEIGRLDINSLPEELVRSWDILWTVDGGQVGTFDVACMSNSIIHVNFFGVSAHPGESGHKLKPAHYAAAKFVHEMSKLPTPMTTKDLKGFYYAVNISGNATKAQVDCVPRTFYDDELKNMNRTLNDLALRIAEEADLRVEVKIIDSCKNTMSTIDKYRNLLKPAYLAHQEYGYEVKEITSRAGTDGAMINLYYPDLPAPNLGNGSRNIHQLQEFTVVEELIDLPKIMLSMIGHYARIGK